MGHSKSRKHRKNIGTDINEIGDPNHTYTSLCIVHCPLVFVSRLTHLTGRFLSGANLLYPC